MNRKGRRVLCVIVSVFIRTRLTCFGKNNIRRCFCQKY